MRVVGGIVNRSWRRKHAPASGKTSAEVRHFGEAWLGRGPLTVTARAGEERRLGGWLIQIAGWAVIALVSVDIYLTVLVARSGTGVFTERLIPATWRVFLWASDRLPRRWCESVLCFSGPTILVVMGCAWVGGMGL